ncbi:hypothetical protein [Sphingomonas parapaucimobilis]|uniref:hypothetical protein n=1 Tax=Sphingomonas parapaucimobilis TaxID=28213 RepID=UPI0032199D5C
MTTDAVMHGLGIASLTIFCLAGAGAVSTIAHMLVTHWHKINAAYRGAWVTGHIHHPVPAPSNDFVPGSTNARRAA